MPNLSSLFSNPDLMQAFQVPIVATFWIIQCRGLLRHSHGSHCLPVSSLRHFHYCHLHHFYDFTIFITSIFLPPSSSLPSFYHYLHPFHLPLSSSSLPSPPLQDPEVSEAVQDIIKNPANISKYQNHPKVKKVIDKMSSFFGAGPDLAGSEEPSDTSSHHTASHQPDVD